MPPEAFSNPINGNKMIDIHSHILPGMDDGAHSRDEALEMLRIAERDGIEKIVATPHLFRGEFEGKDQEARPREMKALNRHLKAAGIQIELFSGAEVHISHDLLSKVQAHRKQLVINGSSYMIVEFPSEHIFPGIKDLFFEIMNEGIIPIIAHPERNSVFTHKPQLLVELIQMGSLAQANRGSFLGLYGNRPKEFVFKFLQWNLVHFIGSDAHNVRSLIPRLSDALKLAADRIGEKSALALVTSNPLAVLNDEEIPYHPEPVSPVDNKKSLKIKLPRFRRSPK